MARGIWLVAAGLAVTAAAGGSAVAINVSDASHMRETPAVAVGQAPAVAGRQAPTVAAGQAAAVAGRQAAAGRQAGVGPGSVVTAARDAGHAVAGRSGFQRWWVGGGHRQYQRVASDLSNLIIKDVLRDDDDTWSADSRHLVADATAASRNLPPVDGTAYHSAMVELARAGRESLDNSFDKAYAYVKEALPKLAAFNTVISARLTSAQINAPVS